MNHFTNFFTKLKEYFKDLDVTIRVKEKNDRYTVMVIPEMANANKLKPLTITGTAKELDDDFFGKVQEAVSVAEGLTSNIDEVRKDAADLAAAVNKPPKEKPSKKKEKPAHKAKTAEPPAPEQRDIFNQAPPEEPTTDDTPDPAPEETEEENSEVEVQEPTTDEDETTDDEQPE